MFYKKQLLSGNIDFPGKGIITDEEVWQVVKKHSRFIDRLSNRKMIEMALDAQLILCGIYENEGYYADKNDWTFFGKKGFYSCAVERNPTKGEYKRFRA